MVQEYKGPYQYSDKVVGDWNSDAIGVYYCGYLSNDKLSVLYVGKGVGDGGIRGRLLDHLRKGYWSDVTHFGYRVCSTTQEAEDFEASEILRLQPRYNKQGKAAPGPTPFGTSFGDHLDVPSPFGPFGR